MSTYKNSEYILWTDDNGQYWLRIRRTGEQTPISNEIAQAIWSEMKCEETYQKKVTFIDSEGHRRSRLLSLDAINSENSERSIIRNEQWIGIRENGFEKVDADMLEERLLKKVDSKAASGLSAHRQGWAQPVGMRGSLWYFGNCRFSST